MDKKLLTPGPLTTSMSTKEAMLHDWGSRDTKFIDLNASIRDSLVKLIDGEDKYQCVPMQGSGTFAVESMVSSLTQKDSKILILINGAYGKRKKNQKVVIWHEENPERMKILRNLPVLGICSNQPELVNPIFKNNSEWPVEVVCHRGLNSLAPENSLASTLLALSFGFSHVEIDIRTTADKKLIINHDSTFNRTSNYKGYVNQTLSSSLDKIEIGKKFNSDFTNQQIPKLEEILEIVELYNGNLYAEIKDGKVDDVINTINKFNYLEKCFFWSENKNIMMDIINFNPNLNYMLRRQDFDTLNEIIENYNPKIIEYTLRDKLEELNILKQKNIKSMIAYMGNDEKVLKKIIQLKTDYVNLDQPILFSSFYSKEYS